MKCLSCQSEIDPKWKYALDSNVCPFCGESILPEDLKEHISNLSATLASFQESYPEQLEDWLFSNHNYVKTDGERIKQFFPKPETKVVYREHQSPSEEGVVAVQSPEVTSKFFKNAEASKSVSRTEELKKMVEQIKIDNPKLAARMHQQDEEQEEMIESSLSTYDEDIPAAVLAFANQKSAPAHDYSAKDMMRLQQLQQKTIDARRNIANGTGGKGSFSRSG